VSDADAPVLSLEDVRVEYGSESALMEALPDGVKQRFGWEYDRVRAVDGVSLEVGENDVVAVIGESGSGKTTLGKTAVGLREPEAGSVRYRGTDVWELKRRKRIDDMMFEDARQALQIIHQDPSAALNPYRTIMTTLTQPLSQWFPDMTGADRRERVLSLLRECGMTPAKEYENRYPHELSGGEQQRVALLRAMMVEPDLIMADEPVSALDTSLRVDLMDLMLELQDLFDTSYLFVSHHLAHARYIASKADGRIAIMYLGRIVESGPIEEVIGNPSHPYTRILKWATLPAHPDRAREALESDSPLRQLDVPDLVDPPAGCRFHTRCPKAREACVATSPESAAVDGDGNGDGSAADHEAACHRVRSQHEYWDSSPLDEAGEREIPSD